MASYLRPRRGKKATATSQLTASAPLKRGEIFFEVPDTGVGTGTGKIKMGDGTTAYSSLPYFMEQPTVDYTNAVVAWTNTTAADSDPYSTNATYANKIAPSASLKTIFTNLKKLLMNYNSQLTTLNNDLGNKMNVANPTFEGMLKSNSFASVGNLQVINTLQDGYMYVGNGNLIGLNLEVKGKSYPVDQYFNSTDDLKNKFANAQNIQLYTSNGFPTMAADIGAKWSSIPAGYGNISVNNGGTIYHGTYMKYSDTIGTIFMTDVSSFDKCYIWSCNGGNYILNDFLSNVFSKRTDGWWTDYNSSYSDANNININGCGNTIGGSYTNLPSDTDGWGTLYCFTSGTNILQFYFGWNAGQLWYRVSHQDYGNWSQWINLNSVAATANAAYDKVVALENKFNNLFSQSGNTLTINY